VPVSQSNNNVQTQVFDLLGKVQDRTIESVRTVAETVEGYVPELPSLPYSDRLPEPASVVDGAFEFAEKLLASQRKFAKELFAAASVKPASKQETARPKVVATKKSA
jgi:hypothetical protein